MKYSCIFNVKRFPFDRTECHFPMNITHQKRTKIHLINKGRRFVVYNGPPIVGQFSIGYVNSSTKYTKYHAQLIFVIPMSRVFTNQLFITFIPTFLLWLFGYSTLFIDIDHSSDRFMGAGTALLVITTLLNAINDDLPKTSYLKLIDVWFVWHILNAIMLSWMIEILRRHMLAGYSLGR